MFTTKIDINTPIWQVRKLRARGIEKTVYHTVSFGPRYWTPTWLQCSFNSTGGHSVTLLPVDSWFIAWAILNTTITALSPRHFHHHMGGAEVSLPQLLISASLRTWNNKGATWVMGRQWFPVEFLLSIQGNYLLLTGNLAKQPTVRFLKFLLRIGGKSLCNMSLYLPPALLSMGLK